MWTRGFAVWWVLLVAAFANGVAREAWLVPATGNGWGHAISSLMLCAAILLLAWLTVPWIHPDTAGNAVRIGAMWLALTLLFEFGAGHYLFRTPWHALLADYNLFAGRIWILVLITTACAPLVTAWGRHLVGGLLPESSG